MVLLCALLSLLLLCVSADGKTKSLVSALSKIAGFDRKVLLVLGESDAMVMRAGRNVEKLTINVAANVQVRQGVAGEGLRQLADTA
jgi:ribosomal protein L4